MTHRRTLIRLVVILLVALIAAGITAYFLTRSTSYQATPQQLQRQFKLIQPHPPHRALPMVPLPRTTTPVPVMSEHVNYAMLSSPYQQGGVGQCQCEAFALQAHLLILRKTGHHYVPSCRFLYSLINQGKDNGSGAEQYPFVISAYGYALNSQYNYAGYPNPSELQFPLPETVLSEARPHRYKFRIHYISAGSNGGPAVTDGIEREVYDGRAVNFAFPVWWNGLGQNSIFDITPTSPTLDIPAHPLANPAGYHAATIIACWRLQQRCLAQNSWGRDWGVNRDGQPAAGHAGYFYVTYRFLQQQAFSVLTFKLSTGLPTSIRATPPPPWFQPSPVQFRPITPPPSKPVPKALAASSYLWVHHVYLNGYGTDMGQAIDNRAAQEGISPVGMLATLGAECGLNFTSTRCDHVWGGADVSFGWCQVTVQTAAGFGLGNGVFDGYYGPNVSRVRNYENNPFNCVYMAGTVLGSYSRYEASVNCPGAAGYPNLYVAWNAGPGQPCWYLMTPNGQGGSNFYNNFLGWYRWAYSYAVNYNPYGGPQPAPKPVHKFVFHRKLWGKHSPYDRDHHYDWQFWIWYTHHPKKLGHYKAESWHPGHPGFMRYDYQHGTAYGWTNGAVRVIYNR